MRAAELLGISRKSLRENLRLQASSETEAEGRETDELTRPLS